MPLRQAASAADTWRLLTITGCWLCFAMARHTRVQRAGVVWVWALVWCGCGLVHLWVLVKGGTHASMCIQPTHVVWEAGGGARAFSRIWVCIACGAANGMGCGTNGMHLRPRDTGTVTVGTDGAVGARGWASQSQGCLVPCAGVTGFAAAPGAVVNLSYVGGQRIGVPSTSRVE